MARIEFQYENSTRVIVLFLKKFLRSSVIYKSEHTSIRFNPRIQSVRPLNWNDFEPIWIERNVKLFSNY